MERDPQRTEAQRNAWNRAFAELELGWHWDSATWQGLQGIDCERERLRRFVQDHHGHLLAAYDPDFLFAAVQGTRERLDAAARA